MNVADLMSTVYQELDDTLAQYSTYWKEEVWPFAMEVWYKLDVPSWEVYRPALQFFVEDLWRIGQSASHLAYLTGKPFVILLGMLLHVAWEVGKVVFDVLLEQGWVQLQQGWVQLKVTAIWFVQFQSKLSTTELLGEVAIVGLIVGLFYLCRWIRQQSYWSRCVQWYTKKKERAMEVSLARLQQTGRDTRCCIVICVGHACVPWSYARCLLLECHCQMVYRVPNGFLSPTTQFSMFRGVLFKSFWRVYLVNRSRLGKLNLEEKQQKLHVQHFCLDVVHVDLLVTHNTSATHSISIAL